MQETKPVAELRTQLGQDVRRRVAAAVVDEQQADARRLAAVRFKRAQVEPLGFVVTWDNHRRCGHDDILVVRARAQKSLRVSFVYPSRLQRTIARVHTSPKRKRGFFPASRP